MHTTRVNCAIFVDCTDDDDDGDAHRSSVAVAVAVAVAAVAATPSSSVRRVRPSARCGGICRDEECDAERWDGAGWGLGASCGVTVHIPIRKTRDCATRDDDDDDDAC